MNIIIAAHLGRISQAIDIQADDLIHNGDLVKLVEQAWHVAGLAMEAAGGRSGLAEMADGLGSNGLPSIITESVAALNALADVSVSPSKRYTAMFESIVTIIHGEVLLRTLSQLPDYLGAAICEVAPDEVSERITIHVLPAARRTAFNILRARGLDAIAEAAILAEKEAVRKVDIATKAALDACVGDGSEEVDIEALGARLSAELNAAFGTDSNDDKGVQVVVVPSQATLH